MANNKTAALKAASPYSAVLTREQFLFYETRATAKLMADGLSREEIVERIVSENLFQYPTERSIRQMARTCIQRLDALEDERLVEAVAQKPQNTAKQVCLYAMMKQYRLMWDFMITVIGEKYRLLDNSFGKMDINGFFLRLQEQDDWVAAWSDSTIAKLKQVIVRVLVENEYLDSIKSTRLNPVLIGPLLEEVIRESGNTQALLAFNCFG